MQAPEVALDAAQPVGQDDRPVGSRRRIGVGGEDGGFVPEETSLAHGQQVLRPPDHDGRCGDAGGEAHGSSTA